MQRFRRLLPFFVPFSIIVGAGLGAKVWFVTTAQGRCHSWQDRALDSLTDPGCVTVSGMAHYPVVLKQKVPGNAFQDETTYYLFPFFGAHDTSSRGVRVLVRTTRAPERLVSYEMMTVSGRLSRPTPDKVPFDTEIMLDKRSDYFLEDDLWLLEPDKVVSGEELWTAP